MHGCATVLPAPPAPPAAAASGGTGGLAPSQWSGGGRSRAQNWPDDAKLLKVGVEVHAIASRKRARIREFNEREQEEERVSGGGGSGGCRVPVCSGLGRAQTIVDSALRGGPYVGQREVEEVTPVVLRRVHEDRRRFRARGKMRWPSLAARTRGGGRWAKRAARATPCGSHAGAASCRSRPRTGRPPRSSRAARGRLTRWPQTNDGRRDSSAHAAPPSRAIGLSATRSCRRALHSDGRWSAVLGWYTSGGLGLRSSHAFAVVQGGRVLCAGRYSVLRWDGTPGGVGLRLTALACFGGGWPWLRLRLASKQACEFGSRSSLLHS
eukprot:3481209-Prymnesium_polylepis.2